MKKYARLKEPEDFEETGECPYGGDVADDCAGCAEGGDYHFDEKTGECVKR